ncbi:hypothetical protein [Dactylosporangium sp. CS-033363]|uniref:hypothetical protein n=1 Tax=Dactylosporangium sp. CS-033363 TaxID=3239935 RepID=UPI003D934EB8
MRFNAVTPTAAWIAVLPTPSGPLFDARTKTQRGTWPAMARAAVPLPDGRTFLLAAGLAGPRRFDLTAGVELPPVADPAEVLDVAAAGRSSRPPARPACTGEPRRRGSGWGGGRSRALRCPRSRRFPGRAAG